MAKSGALMTLHRLELEGVNTAEALLKGYNPATESWNIPREGDFWEAVQHAHTIGLRGNGQRVAIIDSGCDLSIPRLKRRVGKVRKLVPTLANGRNHRHGTAVSMLITEVAPEATLDIYNVMANDGSVDEAATIAAITEAAASDATVINLSLGKPAPWLPSGKPAVSPPDYPQERKRSEISEKNPCRLCDAAAQAADAGKLVFAAVGNDLRHAYCPARDYHVVAVGFQHQIRETPLPDKEIFSLTPVLEQSIHSDIMLLGPARALGSSFACPLYAGAAALGLSQDELWKFIASYAARVFPMRAHALADTADGGLTKATPETLEAIEEGYWKTFSLLPHAHCDLHSQRLPNAPRSDPKHCPFCGIFAKMQYVNFGYWLFGTGRPREAIDVLHAAQALCPWDAQPMALQGSAYHALGERDTAIAFYELAVKMRPGHQPYIHALETIQLEAGRASGFCGPTWRPLEPELAEMPFRDLTRWRRRVVRNVNRVFSVVTSALLALHFAFPATAFARWLLWLPALFALNYGRQCFSDMRLSRLQTQSVPDYATRREVYVLTRLLWFSAACSLLAALVLIIVIFFF